MTEWSKIESAFRLMAFRTYYERAFADELDLTVRFAMALVASSKPIPDKQAVIDWYACTTPEAIANVAIAARRRAGMGELCLQGKQAVKSTAEDSIAEDSITEDSIAEDSITEDTEVDA